MQTWAESAIGKKPMKTRIICLIIAVGLFSAATASADCTIDTTWTIADMTAQHNVVRTAINAGTQVGPAATGNVQPVPTNALPPFTWSAAIAATSATWALTCPQIHDPALAANCVFPGTGGNGGGTCGENLFFSASSVDPTVWTAANAVVASWAGESLLYNHGTNGCTGVCGHYTAIAHHPSNLVGCSAYKENNVIAPFGFTFPGVLSAVGLVCRYNGIQIGGTKPYCAAAGGTCALPVELMNFEIS